MEDWKTAWDDPKKILEIQHENERTALILQSIQNKIKSEIRLKDSLKGNIFERERKAELLKEIRIVDEKLADSVAAIPRIEGTADAIEKKSIEQAIDQRLHELKEENNKSESIINGILSQQRDTNNTAQEIIRRYLAIMKELASIRKKQIENEQKNDTYGIALKTAMNNNTFEANKKNFENDAVAYLERIQENLALDEQAFRLMEEKTGLIEKSRFVQKQFEQQT
ncbi:MAG TPA: hypothetical protein VKE88_01390, partial [Candidatus Nanoarchaeia archaeon]|nr:hypothetical protein [Candidatus Nanoarchaeia archaeon]